MNAQQTPDLPEIVNKTRELVHQTLTQIELAATQDPNLVEWRDKIRRIFQHINGNFE